MAVIYRLLHLAGWERWFEFGRASRWRWKPKLTAGLDYRHVLHVGGLIFMFGESTEEQRKAAWAEVMAEAEELSAGIRTLDAQYPSDAAAPSKDRSP